jgi:hypothetical protein
VLALVPRVGRHGDARGAGRNARVGLLVHLGREDELGGESSDRTCINEYNDANKKLLCLFQVRTVEYSHDDFWNFSVLFPTTQFRQR